MPIYAIISGGIVAGLTQERPAPPAYPPPIISVDVTNIDPRPSDGWYYTPPSTFVSPDDHDTRPWLHIFPQHPTENRSQTEIFEMRETDMDPVTGLPKAGNDSKWIKLRVVYLGMTLKRVQEI